jgi:hypothetical protein
VTRVLAIGLLVTLAALTGCTPEGFDVTACSLNGKLAFRIEKIDGWFSDYEPRPDSVIVLAEGYGPGSTWPGVWSAELKYHGARHDAHDSRPVRKLIVYGQRLPEWEVGQRAKPLELGKGYWFNARDGGRSGAVRFVAGAHFGTC